MNNFLKLLKMSKSYFVWQISPNIRAFPHGKGVLSCGLCPISAVYYYKTKKIISNSQFASKEVLDTVGLSKEEAMRIAKASERKDLFYQEKIVNALELR